MNLSNDAIQLLRWLRRHDQWCYIEVLQNNYKRYEYRSFAALKDAGFVETTVFEFDYENPEYDEDGIEYFRVSYRISDAGKAYLEELPNRWLPELREWVAVGISLIALILSIIAIVSG